MTTNNELRDKAIKLLDSIRSKSIDEVKVYLAKGKAFLELYNLSAWGILKFQDWDELCNRGAQMSVKEVDEYIRVYMALSDIKVDDHEYVPIGRLIIILPLCVNLTATRTALREARKAKDKDALLQYRRKRARELRRLGYPMPDCTKAFSGVRYARSRSGRDGTNKVRKQQQRGGQR